MFTPLDKRLFPDNNCDVYRISDDHFVYGIYKNGHSSINATFEKTPILDIKKISNVTVYIRDPLDRYVSGVRQYLKDEPGDHPTLLAFIDKFLFINRHFMPQFFWLLHLAKYTSSNVKISIKHINELHKLTTLRWNQSNIIDNLRTRFETNKQLNFYLLADDLLYKDLMNKTLPLTEIFTCLKEKNSNLYNEIFLLTKEMANVLP